MNAEELAAVLRASRFVFANEEQLQAAIAAALRHAGVDVDREVTLSHACRIDFVAGRVGIEVKVQGNMAGVSRQLSRYAASDRVDELLLVTTRSHHRSVPRRAGGKPVHVVRLVTGL